MTSTDSVPGNFRKDFAMKKEKSLQLGCLSLSEFSRSSMGGWPKPFAVISFSKEHKPLHKTFSHFLGAKTSKLVSSALQDIKVFFSTKVCCISDFFFRFVIV